MQYYKASDNSVHCLDNPEFESKLPEAMVAITLAEAEALCRASVAQVVPQSVEMAQARLALLAAGLLDQVETALSQMEGAEGKAARIEWEFRAHVSRSSALVQTLAGLLELSSSELDILFTQAAGL